MCGNLQTSYSVWAELLCLGKQHCRSHPLSKRMSAIRAHLLARSPPLALLEVADWDCAAAKQPENVLKSILGGPEDVGLRSVPGYRVELPEVRARGYSLPLDGTRLHISMVREVHSRLHDGMDLARSRGAAG